MLLARESLRHFLESLRRPLGVAAPSASSRLRHGSGPSPRLPRAFAGFFLIASLAMLGLPEIRGTLASSVLFRQTGIHEYFHGRNIERLREIARANHDPQLLAFLSLALSYSNERFSLADEAIRRDPSLTWIDYHAAWWFWNDTDRNHFLSDERIARLRTFDSQNAAPPLLRAEVISHPVQVAYYAMSQGSGITEVPVWQRAIRENAAWLAAMDCAFEAPRFHEYSAQQIELVRQVSDRYHITDPDLLNYALLTHRLWDYGNIEAYSLFLLESGSKEAERGNWALATKDYENIQRFAEKIRDGSESDWDRWSAAKIGSKAARKLQTAFERSGHPAEAQIAATQLAAWNDTSAKFQSVLRQNASGGKTGRPWSRAERAGLFINLAVLLVVFAFPLATAALLTVGFAASYSRRRVLSRFYRFICVAADVAPIVLALSFALLIITYHPYAHPFQNAATREQAMTAVAVAHTLPRAAGLFVWDLFYTSGRYYLWVGLTTALSLVFFLLLYRMTLKRRHHDY